MESRRIRNLLFDLGGVVMDIDRDACAAAFERLGMTCIDSFLGEYSQKGPFGQLEAGAIGPDEFRRQVRAMLPPGVTDAEIDSAFCSFLLTVPVTRLRELERLRAAGYRLGLLSNTNPIMWHGPILEAFRADGHDIGHYFDLGVVTSFEARLMKPDPAIFQYTAEHLGIDPGETWFLDDSAANMEAAWRCGYRGAVVEPRREFTEFLPPATTI